MEAQKSVDRNRKTYEQHKKNMEENQKQDTGVFQGYNIVYAPIRPLSI